MLCLGVNRSYKVHPGWLRNFVGLGVQLIMNSTLVQSGMTSCPSCRNLTKKTLQPISQNLFELITHQDIGLYADTDLRTHAAHCVATESSRGWKISKEKAANKIDGIVALAMAGLEAVRQGSETPLILGWY